MPLRDLIHQGHMPLMPHGSTRHWLSWLLDFALLKCMIKSCEPIPTSIGLKIRVVLEDFLSLNMYWLNSTIPNLNLICICISEIFKTLLFWYKITNCIFESGLWIHNGYYSTGIKWWYYHIIFSAFELLH